MVIKATIFAAISTAVMLQRAGTKHIMITDAAGMPVDRGGSEDSYNILVDRNVPGGKEDILTIPLPKSVSSDNIILEDRHIDHELLIYVDSREEGFYKDNAVYCSRDVLKNAVCVCENDTGSVCLDFTMNGLYATESLLTDQGTIEVSFFDPAEKYEKVAVVDPRVGADDSDEISLAVARQIKAIADKDETSGVKLYFTRLEGQEAAPDKKLDFMEEASADLFVGLDVLSSPNGGQKGILTEYNDRFFLRDLSNAEFANMMEKSCLAATGSGAVGVTASSDDILLASRVPSVVVNLGYATNEEDAARLSDPAYIKRMAEGIYNGILEAFEEKR